MKFIIDLELDGYETEEAMELACLEFLDESLNMTASSVEIYSGEKFDNLLEIDIEEGKTPELMKKWKIDKKNGSSFLLEWLNNAVIKWCN